MTDHRVSRKASHSAIAGRQYAAPAAPALTVSVVIPVKDDSAELARCLAALERQTRRADEIIVVDNGSADDSADVARAAGVTLVKCSQEGIPAASAQGYDSASGDLILRLDADCVPAEDWLEALATAFAGRPDVSAFTGGAHFMDGPAALRGPLASVYLFAYAAATVPALGHLPLFGSNLAFRRAAWNAVRSEVHRHRADIHDDLDLAFHIGQRHRIRYLRGARMGMSIRPFRSASSFGVRMARGFRTVTTHWPRQFPPLRWTRLVLSRSAAPTANELAHH